MYRTWTGSADDPETVARALEAHLNEFADVVISVAYAVDAGHHVLAVYTEIDAGGDRVEEAAVAVAEQIIDNSV